LFVAVAGFIVVSSSFGFIFGMIDLKRVSDHVKASSFSLMAKKKKQLIPRFDVSDKFQISNYCDLRTVLIDFGTRFVLRQSVYANQMFLWGLVIITIHFTCPYFILNNEEVKIAISRILFYIFALFSGQFIIYMVFASVYNGRLEKSVTHIQNFVEVVEEAAKSKGFVTSGDSVVERLVM
jgi:hypothetical protein